MIPLPLRDYNFYLFLFSTLLKMDTHIFISVLSLMYSWILCTVLSAPAGEAPPGSSSASPDRHVRTKRCSCASFLDKECVYFCHLDIIWVNTPERVVSYGLGNAPRAKRALPDSMATGRSAPRCQCARGSDRTCRTFCGPLSEQPPLGSATVNLRPAARAEGCRGARCKHEQEADTSSVNRLAKKSHDKQARPLALRMALRTRLLLEKWRAGRRHRARAWEGESATS